MNAKKKYQNDTIHMVMYYSKTVWKNRFLSLRCKMLIYITSFSKHDTKWWREKWEQILVIHLNAVTTHSDEITNFRHSSQCGHTQKFSWTVLGKNQSAIYYVITRRYICQTNKYIACIWTFQKVCKYYFSIFFYILKQKWFHFWHLCPYNEFY